MFSHKYQPWRACKPRVFRQVCAALAAGRGAEGGLASSALLRELEISRPINRRARGFVNLRKVRRTRRRRKNKSFVFLSASAVCILSVQLDADITPGLTLHPGALTALDSARAAASTRVNLGDSLFPHFIGSEGDDSLCCLNASYLFLAPLRPSTPSLTRQLLRISTPRCHPLWLVRGERLRQMGSKYNFPNKTHSQCSGSAAAPVSQSAAASSRRVGRMLTPPCLNGFVHINTLT